MITRSKRHLLQKPEVICRPGDSEPETTPTRVKGDGSSVLVDKKTLKVTVSIHASTILAQAPEKSPSRRIESSSDVTFVKQRRAVLWTNREKEACYKATSKHHLYASVEVGGYGLKSIRDAIEESTMYTWAYVCTRADLKASYNLFKSMLNRNKRSILKDAGGVLSSFNIEMERPKACRTCSTV